ncbi:hypothetical protein BBJ29_009971 [Phytophthora kernoviae]|uniref:Uncharacterized protein n=1 Tax=Phytophthora kernoviae TaxID=325452 RepID=A0A3R7MWZ0_9STRA|nr:hypothetical protein BBJ29_009971 [Phytophthora kernoviae]
MKLRILTFNVFFDEVARSVRMKSIGRLVEHVRPAIIGFQEVTQESLALLKAQNWAQYYDCIKSLETHPFANTGMGRELVFMQVEPVPGKTLFVGTSHLESLPQFAGPRVSQLKESLTILRDRVVNSENEDDAPTTTEDEKKLVKKKSSELRGEEQDDGDEDVDLATMGLPGGWKDLWLSVPGNTEDNGYTFDGLLRNLCF